MKNHLFPLTKSLNKERHTRTKSRIVKMLTAAATVSVAVSGSIAFDSAIFADSEIHRECAHCGELDCEGECGVTAIDRLQFPLLNDSGETVLDGDGIAVTETENYDAWVDRAWDLYEQARNTYQGENVSEDEFDAAYAIAKGEINMLDSSVADYDDKVKAIMEERCGKLGFYQHAAEQYQGDAECEADVASAKLLFESAKSVYKDALTDDTASVEYLESLLQAMTAAKEALSAFGALGEFVTAQIDYEAAVQEWADNEKADYIKAVEDYEVKEQDYLGCEKSKWDDYNSAKDALELYVSDLPAGDWDSENDAPYQALLANLSIAEAAIAAEVEIGNDLGKLGAFISAKSEYEDAKIALDTAGDNYAKAFAVYKGTGGSVWTTFDGAKKAMDDLDKEYGEFVETYQLNYEGSDWETAMLADSGYLALMLKMDAASQDFADNELTIAQALLYEMSADPDFDPGTLGRYYFAKDAYSQAKDAYDEASIAAEAAKKKYESAVIALGYSKADIEDLSTAKEIKEWLKTLNSAPIGVLVLWEAMSEKHETAEAKKAEAEYAQVEMTAAHKEAHIAYLQYKVTFSEALDEYIAKLETYKEWLLDADFDALLDALQEYSEKFPEDPYQIDVLAKYFGKDSGKIWQNLTSELRITAGMSDEEKTQVIANRLKFAETINLINQTLADKVEANDNAGAALNKLTNLLDAIADIDTSARTPAQIKSAIEGLKIDGKDIWQLYTDALAAFGKLDQMCVYEIGDVTFTAWFADLYNELINTNLKDYENIADRLSKMVQHMDSIKGNSTFTNKLQIGDGTGISDSQGARDMVGKVGTVHQRKSGTPLSKIEKDNVNLNMILVKAGDLNNNNYYMTTVVTLQDIGGNDVGKINLSTPADSKSTAEKSIVDALLAKEGLTVRMSSGTNLPADMKSNTIINNMDGNLLAKLEPFVTGTNVTSGTSSANSKGALLTLQPGVSINILYCLVDNNWTIKTFTNDTPWEQHYLINNFHYHETAFSINTISPTPPPFEGVVVPPAINDESYEAPPNQIRSQEGDLTDNVVTLAILPELPLPKTFGEVELVKLSFPEWEEVLPTAPIGEEGDDEDDDKPVPPLPPVISIPVPPTPIPPNPPIPTPPPTPIIPPIVKPAVVTAIPAIISPEPMVEVLVLEIVTIEDDIASPQLPPAVISNPEHDPEAEVITIEDVPVPLGVMIAPQTSGSDTILAISGVLMSLLGVIAAFKKAKAGNKKQ